MGAEKKKDSRSQSALRSAEAPSAPKLADQQPTEQNVSEPIPTVRSTIVRSPLPPFSTDIFRHYAWYEIDEGSVPLLECLDPASRRAYEKLGRLPGPVRYELGNFRLDPFRTVSFEMIPAFGEVAYSEVDEYPPGFAIPPKPDTTEKDHESPSPLLRFLQLTDKGIPVPRMMKELDDSSDEPEVQRALAGRDFADLTDSFGTMADFNRDNLVLTDNPPTTAAFVNTCFNGGADVFSSTYCESKGTFYCDSGAWVDLTRSSGSHNRKVSHSRVAACGVFGTRLEHQYRFWSFWDAKWKWNAVQYPLATNQWYQDIGAGEVKYWKHVGSKKRQRKIHIWSDPPPGGSYFRSWTAFYN